MVISMLIYFEVEKINTLVDGEFLMTILSSVAQQEVENTSAYVKKGLKMKMKRGELVGFSRCFGYDRDKETGELKIVESEAETVRHIFDRYLQGAGGTVIARELNEEGILTYNNCKWTCSTILIIIKNEMDDATKEQFIHWSAELDLRYDRVFSIIDIQEENMEKWRNVLPFYQNIQKEGIILWKAE